MSWHCFCKDSVNTEKPWVQISIAFIDGGIPINLVCHAECLRNLLCCGSIEESGIQMGTKSIWESFNERISDIKKIESKEEHK